MGGERRPLLKFLGGFFWGGGREKRGTGRTAAAVLREGGKLSQKKKFSRPRWGIQSKKGGGAPFSSKRKKESGANAAKGRKIASRPAKEKKTAHLNFPRCIGEMGPIGIEGEARAFCAARRRKGMILQSLERVVMNW